MSGEVKAVVRDSKICLSDSELQDLHLCVGDHVELFEGVDGCVLVKRVSRGSGSVNPNSAVTNKMQSFFFIPAADGGESVE